MPAQASPRPVAAALLAAAALSLALAPSAQAERRRFTPEDLLATHRVDDVQVSPDGRWASFTVRQKSLPANRDLRDVWLLPLRGGEPRALSHDGRTEHARWSPDGSRLLVDSTRAGTPQLFVYDLAGGGDAVQLTNLASGASGGLWSPDGRTIAFVADVFPSCRGDDACQKREEEAREKSGVKARVVDHLFARHWTEWKDGKRTHVFTLALSGRLGPVAAVREATSGDADWPSFSLRGTDDYALSRDGQAVYVASKPSAREAWSTNGDVWAVPAAGGAPRNLTASNRGDDAQPKLSPDGRTLAILSQATDGYESDQWKLRLLDLATGTARELGRFSDDVGSAVWRPDGKGLVVSVDHHGRTYLHELRLDGSSRQLSQEPVTADFAVAPDGTVICVQSGMNRPPELVALAPDGRVQRLTHFNDAQVAQLDLGPAPEDLWITSTDGQRVHSFVLKPAGLKGRAPLLVLIHGGPQGAWEDQWGMRWNPSVFAGRGYVVVMVNPRGSTGYGRQFEAQISQDWGGKVVDDILRSVDAAEALPYVERGHTCAAGASFGGYMIDWLAGHTDRFRCLITHDGVFDLRSMYGATEELWFPEWELGGPYWVKPEAYAKWSPSSYVQNFKTPTLVIQGELDFRVPTEQGLGMFTALQRRGVESRLLWFPDEGHWVLKPRNSQLWFHTMLDWVDAHAK